jgi:hypothetical protein
VVKRVIETLKKATRKTLNNLPYELNFSRLWTCSSFSACAECGSSPVLFIPETTATEKVLISGKLKS